MTTDKDALDMIWTYEQFGEDTHRYSNVDLTFYLTGSEARTFLLILASLLEDWSSRKFLRCSFFGSVELFNVDFDDPRFLTLTVPRDLPDGETRVFQKIRFSPADQQSLYDAMNARTEEELDREFAD